MYTLNVSAYHVDARYRVPHVFSNYANLNKMHVILMWMVTRIFRCTQEIRVHNDWKGYLQSRRK